MEGEYNISCERGIGIENVSKVLLSWEKGGGGGGGFIGSTTPRVSVKWVVCSIEEGFAFFQGKERRRGPENLTKRWDRGLDGKSKAWMRKDIVYVYV